MNPQNNDNEEAYNLPANGRQHSFAVPDGYFEKLPGRIIAKIELAQELEEFALLASIKKEQKFEIPADYFNTAENELEYKHELTEFEALAKIGKAEKETNFAVRADYFETVADRVKEKYYAEKETVPVFSKVIAFLSKPRVAFVYSILIIICAGLFYTNNKQAEVIIPAAAGDCETLACLEKREMLNEHTIREMNTDDLYDMVDVDALSKQLSDSTTTDSLSVKGKNMDTIKNN